jgi:hypothetical protein
MAPALFVARFPSPGLVKNSPFSSCAGLLKLVGSVAVTGLVDAVNLAFQPGTSKAGRYLHLLPLRSPLTRDRPAYCQRLLLPLITQLPRS